MEDAIHGGGLAPQHTMKVYYTGSDKLLEGYALCYNYDVADVTAENLALTLADSLTATPARRLQVKKPNAHNALHFAGVVSARSNGVTGPGWIEINRPGSVCNIFVYADCDENGSVHTAASSGQMLTFTCDTYFFKYAGCPGSGSAIILGDVNRGTTKGLVQAELMTGPPSGGVQAFFSNASALTQTGSSLTASTNWLGASGLGEGAAAEVSLGGSMYFTPAGVTYFALSAVAATVFCSIPICKSRGMWTGQVKSIRSHSLGLLVADAFVLYASTVTRAVNSVQLTHALTLTISLLMSDPSITTSENGVGFTWNGSSWNFTSLTSSLATVTT